MEKELIKINEDELAFFSKKNIHFEDGTEFKNNTHAYTIDLDIFGPKSLFQYLNRTATHAGKIQLARLLSGMLGQEEIKANQEAIRELAGKTGWRQQLLARARLSADSKTIYERLLNWAQYDKTQISKPVKILSYLLPAMFIAALLLYYLDIPLAGNITFLLFILNLSFSYSVQKKAAEEIIHTHKIDEIIKDYSSVLGYIEQEEFKSPRLKDLQNQLQYHALTASLQIKKLSALFSRIDNVQHLIGGLILNGFFQYHIHTIIALVKWKKEHAGQVEAWLQVIGETEALNSLANFSCNNPGFAFPQLNNNYEINFTDIGHPLIPEDKRVCNSVSFQQHRFIILTGSNMSGKSTFLRTLGINMVLGGTGAPVCAAEANIHPLPVLVSMGQTDSLADNESYFFAEVKRLKYIMEKLDQQTSFVLLDEILRGTNSDDKRNGTVGVIEKIIRRKAIGAIATHDLEVCLTTDRHPEALINKCFEVEIINNELSFDYRLRNGICQNQSATFLMKKMKIIN
jgi:DNA mismatch repair ATPase MutS